MSAERLNVESLQRALSQLQEENRQLRHEMDDSRGLGISGGGTTIASSSTPVRCQPQVNRPDVWEQAMHNSTMTLLQVMGLLLLLLLLLLS